MARLFVAMPGSEDHKPPQHKPPQRDAAVSPSQRRLPNDSDTIAFRLGHPWAAFFDYGLMT